MSINIIYIFFYCLTNLPPNVLIIFIEKNVLKLAYQFILLNSYNHLKLPLKFIKIINVYYYT